MPKLVSWDPKYNVGIPEIDEQHQKLFELINTAFSAITETRDKKKLKKAFDEIIDYTRFHFKTEEGLFDKHGYPDTEEHKKQHAKVLQEAEALKTKYTQEAYGVITLELIDYLHLWLQRHIVLHDQHFAPFMKNSENHDQA